MPKQQKKTPTRNNTRKNSQLNGNRAVVVHGDTQPLGASPFSAVSVFPARLRTTMTYQDMVNTLADGTTSTTSGSSVAFQLNSVFQPRSGGHQPYGFDTVATMYRRYHVYRARLDITAMYNAGTDKYIFAGLIVLPSGATFDPGAQATFSQILGEKPLGRVMLLTQDAGHTASSMLMDVDMARVEGLTQQEYDSNSNYRAEVTSNPTLMPTLKLANAAPSTVTMTCVWRVRISFDVEFYERKVLAQS